MNGVTQAALAEVLLALGEDDAALEAAQRAVEVAWGVPEAHISLGLAYLRAGDARAAYEALAEAVRLRPCEVRGKVLLAAAAAGCGEGQQARRHLCEANELVGWFGIIQGGLGATTLGPSGAPVATALLCPCLRK